MFEAEEIRVCNLCGIEKPLSDYGESFGKRNNKVYKRRMCKKCKTQKSKNNKNHKIQNAETKKSVYLDKKKSSCRGTKHNYDFETLKNMILRGGI
jgi:hypothetical protein